MKLRWSKSLFITSISSCTKCQSIDITGDDEYLTPVKYQTRFVFMLCITLQESGHGNNFNSLSILIQFTRFKNMHTHWTNELWMNLWEFFLIRINTSEWKSGIGDFSVIASFEKGTTNISIQRTIQFLNLIRILWIFFLWNKKCFWILMKFWEKSDTNQS